MLRKLERPHLVQSVWDPKVQDCRVEGFGILGLSVCELGFVLQG